MSEPSQWRPTFRVLAPPDLASGCAGTSLAEIRTLDTAVPCDHGSTAHVVFALTGELCAYSTQVLTPILAELTSSSTDIELDLREVAFADASALTMLLGLDQQLAARGGGLVVDPVSPCLDRLLALTGAELTRSRPAVPVPTPNDAATAADRRPS